MTDDDVKAEGERALVRYSENERTIRCVLSRLGALKDAASRLNMTWEVMGGSDECEAIADILEGRDLRQDVKDLKAALARRPGLAEQLRAHGQGHMLSRD